MEVDSSNDKNIIGGGKRTRDGLTDIENALEEG